MRARDRWRPVEIVVLALAAVVLSAVAGAQTGDGGGGLSAGRSSGLPVPRFVSLESDRVNVRFGPGKQYPINWVYGRAGLPVMVVSEFDTWRRVRDFEGEEGWVHASLLSSRRTIVIQGGVQSLHRTPNAQSRVVLRAEPGVIGELIDCEGTWCRVEIANLRGWLPRETFFGVLEDEFRS